MDQEQKEQIKAAIQEEIIALVAQIQRLEENTGPVAPDRAIGRLTRMEAIQSSALSKANLGQAKKRLNELKKVLPFVDEEDYGICEKCEEEIPFARLMLVPFGKRCVGCLTR